WMAGIKQKLNEISQAHQQARMKAQQQQQQAMGMQMQPSRSHQGEMAPQMPMAPQMMGQMNMQPHMQQPQQQPPSQQQPQQSQQQMAQNQQAQAYTPEEQKQITNLARSMITSVPEDQRNLMRQRLLAQIPPQQREHYQRQGVDPLAKHFQQLAMKKFNASRRPQQGGGPIDFSSFAGQQADAMKMADQGQLVVPASNNNMGMDPAAANMANMGQMNMPPAMQNNQQQIQNMMAQRQQQTQAQMRNTQMQQQAQAQAQARSAAQQQAQQQMLRGQPGGLNTTQPPQQSPAMSML
ncbi:hypothetical protein KCU63_g23365, partial [Aureobasidium melanogenum]